MTRHSVWQHSHAARCVSASEVAQTSSDISFQLLPARMHTHERARPHTHTHTHPHTHGLNCPHRSWNVNSFSRHHITWYLSYNHLWLSLISWHFSHFSSHILWHRRLHSSPSSSRLGHSGNRFGAPTDSFIRFPPAFKSNVTSTVFHSEFGCLDFLESLAAAAS